MDTWALREMVKVATDKAMRQVEAAQMKADLRLMSFSCRLITSKREDGRRSKTVLAEAKLVQFAQGFCDETEVGKI